MATKDKATLTSDLATLFPDNNTELITPAILRSQQTDIIDSFNNIPDDGRIGTSTYGALTNAQILALPSPSDTESAFSTDDLINYIFFNTSWYSTAGGVLT